MFDWFWDFLYQITKWLFEIIDMIMEVSFKIIGIDPISIGNEDTDLISYFLNSAEITYAFAIASLLAIILLVLLSVIAIIRTIVKDKVEDTPLGVCKKAFKNLLLLLLVPTVMISITVLMNAMMKAMYQGLTNSADFSLGKFLFASFASECSTQDYVILAGANYMSTSEVRAVCDLTEFPYIYSWLVSGLMIFALLGCVLSLVERSISIILLYLAAPFCVASAVLDDGQRFKSWRDQVLIKFLTGYGMLMGIVIYGMLCSLIARPSVHFFDGWALNVFTKIVFMLGGGVSLRGVMALVGNLISNGAGEAAMRDQDMAKMGFSRAASALNPLTKVRSAYNFAKDSGRYGMLSATASRLGLKTQKDYNFENGGRGGDPSGNHNTNSPSNNNNNSVANAINSGNNSGNNGNNNGGNNNNNGGGGFGSNNQNNNMPQQSRAGQNMVNNAIAGQNLNSDIR